MPMQINRRLGAGGAPTALAEGQLSYNDPSVVAYDGLMIANDHLYVGSQDSTSAPQIRTLIGADRQVELAGAQTITGAKTIAANLFHLTGGGANDILQTDGAGNLTWTAAPSGGLLSVATGPLGTLTGNGVSGTPLEVSHLPVARNVTIQTAAAAGNGAITTISITPGSSNGSADWTMTNFAITRLDDGTY